MPEIQIQSNDGQIFQVDFSVARMSNTIRTMLDDLGVTPEDAVNQIVPVHNVKSDILKKVIDWSTYHKDDEIFQDENFRCTDSDIFTKWDRDFFKVETITLFEIILAANYLDVKGLLEMGCKTVADMMGGKSAEEIRRTFNIENDLTAEEEEQIRKENAWCEER